MAVPGRSSHVGQSRLLAVADAAAPALAGLWRSWLQDARRAVRRQHAALRRALRFPPSLAVSALLLDVWRETVETPVQREVSDVLSPVFDDAAAVALVPLRVAVEAPVDWEDDAASTAYWLTGYVARQVQQVRQTTVQTWRRVLRDGGLAAQPPGVLARGLEDTFGLSVASAGVLLRLRTRLETEGLGILEVTRRVDQAAQIAVGHRAQRIAQTETVDTVSQAAYAAVAAAVQQGAVHETMIRRYWHTEDDNRVCGLCFPIPGMNADGVGLYEPFQTPVGPAMTPTLHPWCRCEVETRVG